MAYTPPKLDQEGLSPHISRYGVTYADFVKLIKQSMDVFGKVNISWIARKISKDRKTVTAWVDQYKKENSWNYYYHYS